MYTLSDTSSINKEHLSSYYRFHSKIYDYTRWLFLFGRKQIINHLPGFYSSPNILEIGCGTGSNLILLANKYPKSTISGVDLSGDMLSVARKKIEKQDLTSRISLINHAYGNSKTNTANKSAHYDIILCSYSLSMMGSNKADVIHHIQEDLSEDGLLAVVDFHNSPLSWFRMWMRMNHVEISENLYEQLTANYRPQHTKIQPVYGKFWSYFLFLGSGTE